MKKVSFLIAFLSLVIIGVGVHTAIQIGWYPVAIVNGEMIAASRFEKTSNSIYFYYTQAGQFFGTENEVSSKTTQYEVRRATLDKIIENRLLTHKLEELKNIDADQRIADRIQMLEKENPDLQNAVEKLYGVSLEQFKDLVLIPQAKEELVATEGFETHDAYLAWLSGARNNARVYILDPILTWDGGEVTFRR